MIALRDLDAAFLCALLPRTHVSFTNHYSFSHETQFNPAKSILYFRLSANIVIFTSVVT